AAPDPVREPILVDEDVVEPGEVELLCQRVGVLAVAAAAVDDEWRGRIDTLREEGADPLVDVGFPDREESRAGNMPLAVNGAPPRVKEGHSLAEEPARVLPGDFHVWLVGVRRQRVGGRRAGGRGGGCGSRRRPRS